MWAKGLSARVDGGGGRTTLGWRAAARMPQSAERRVQSPAPAWQPSPAHLARPSSSPAAHLPSSGPERDARPADQPARGGGGAGELPPAPMRPSACGRPQKGTTHYPCLRPRRPIDEPKGRVSAATARKQPVCQCVQAVSRRKEQGRAHTSSGGSNNSKHAVGNAWKARHAHT